MSCLIWNARGLGNQCAICEFRRLMDEINPSLIFIIESKLTVSQSRWWHTQFKLTGLFEVICKKRKGGLNLMWREPYAVTIHSYSDGHIDCTIKDELHWCRFTGFYGHPTIGLRYHSWQLLKRLASIHELKLLPWLVGGDFNEILYDSEKAGGVSRAFNQISAFLGHS